MRNARLIIIIVLALATCMGCRHDKFDDMVPIEKTFIASYTPAATEGDVNVSLQSATGDMVILNVSLKSATEFSGSAFKLTYDPVVAQFVGYEQGNLLETFGDPLYGASAVNGVQGNVVVGVTLKRTDPMASGSGTVIRLKFKAISAGTTSLTFSENVIRDNTFAEVGGLSWSAGQISGN